MRPSKAFERHRDEGRAAVRRFGADNPRLFGSVARGEKTRRVTERISRNGPAGDEQAELASAPVMEIVGKIAGRLRIVDWQVDKGRFGADVSTACRLRNVSLEVLYDIARINIPVLVEKARNRLSELAYDRP